MFSILKFRRSLIFAKSQWFISTLPEVCNVLKGLKKAKVRRHVSYNLECQVYNYKLEAIHWRFFAAKLRVKQFPTHTHSTQYVPHLFRRKKARRRGIRPEAKSNSASCLIGQHLVLIIEMMRERASNRLPAA